MLELFTDWGGISLAFAGAGLSVILGGIGSILGMSIAGQASAGVATEKPETFGKVLIMTALPGSQGIYGFVGAFLILFKIGVFGGIADISMATGWQILFASLPVALTCLISGIHQGKVAAAALNIIAKDPSKSGQALTLTVLVETYAILGLLITLFLVMLGITI